MLATRKFTQALEEKEAEYKTSLLSLGSELNDSRAEAADLRSKLASSTGISKSDNINASYQQELLQKVRSGEERSVYAQNRYFRT